MTTEASRQQKDRERRTELRRELYARVDRGDMGLVEAMRMMRKIAGKSQNEYARVVGVSPRILKEFERGVGNPTLETVRKMMRPFRLDVGVCRTRD